MLQRLHRVVGAGRRPVPARRVGPVAGLRPAFFGLRLQRATSPGNGITLSPTLQLAYVQVRALPLSDRPLADPPGSTFLVNGARPARNAGQVKAGAKVAIGARSVIVANFEGEFSGVNQLYAGRGRFRYLW